MSEHPGLLGFLSEANEIKEELGVSADEAFAIQRERSDGRLQELLALKEAVAQSNVIPFRQKH
jgi:hypothetical protein